MLIAITKRIKSMTKNNSIEKYPDKVIEPRKENRRAILQLEKLILKYN